MRADQPDLQVRAKIRRSPEIVASAPALSMRDELSEVAEASPRTALLEAFNRIEKRLREILPSRPTGTMSVMNSVEPARLGLSLGLLSAEAVDGIEGLAVLQDLAHNPREISHAATSDVIDGTNQPAACYGEL